MNEEKELRELRKLRDKIILFQNLIDNSAGSTLVRFAKDLRDKYAPPVNLIYPRDE